MNPKQAAPLIAALPALVVIAPPIIIGGLIGCGILLLLKALSDEEKQPEAASVEASTEARKPAETIVFRQIPAEIPAAKQAPDLLASAPRAVISPPTIQLAPRASVLAPVSQKIVLPIPPPPIKNKFITREDMAAAFHHGARTLTRTNAVAALKTLGFGKTAAYAALTSDGRFADWLQFAPDGLITWTDARKT
jgi:hypothetical protein